MSEPLQALLFALFGGFLGTILTLIAMRWSTLRSIDSAREILRTELLYEEKKKALKELHKLVDQRYPTYPAFKEAILAFLGTLQADFLPVELKGAIESRINDLDRFLVDNRLAAPEPSDEEIDRWINGYQEYLDQLAPDERAEIEFEGRLREIKSTIMHLITEHIRP